MIAPITPIIVISLAAILVYAALQRQVSLLLVLFLFAFFATGGGLAIFPDAANHLAARFSVGRGADLLLYFAVLAGVFVSTNFYFRFKQMERVLTLVIRQMALRNAEQKGTGVQPECE